MPFKVGDKLARHQGGNNEIDYGKAINNRQQNQALPREATMVMITQTIKLTHRPRKLVKVTDFAPTMWTENQNFNEIAWVTRATTAKAALIHGIHFALLSKLGENKHQTE